MPVVGFDFGTTNSLVSIVQGDRATRFLDESGGLTPSMVCYEGGRVIAGNEARSRLDRPGLGVQGNVVRSPKTELRRESIYVGGQERSSVDVVHDAVTFIKAAAEHSPRAGGTLHLDQAVATIPVNMDGPQRARLRDAFRRAGIAITSFVHEPLAALYGYFREQDDWRATLRELDGKLMLVFDWGGGTLDLTLCRLDGGVLVQVGNDGTDEVGGDNFDAALRTAVEQRCRDERSLGSDIGRRPEAYTQLMHRCERAKIDLSERREATVFVANFFDQGEDTDLTVKLTREDLELVVRNLIERGIQRITDLVEKDGYPLAAVNMCLATGGMTEMPAIRMRLREHFGPERVKFSERGSSLVSVGAAWIAHDHAQLRMAKNVELELARNSFFPLIKAGWLLPEGGQTSSQPEPWTFYCVDPTDGRAKFDIVSPDRPGTTVTRGDTRHSLAYLSVDVDVSAKPFQERIWMTVSIDENLILHATAMATNAKSSDSAVIHDLEFALAFPQSRADEWSANTGARSGENQGFTRKPGAVVARSNISQNEDWSMVPGEVVRRVEPTLLDRRHEPSEIQIAEDLYYQPCSLCGRPSNHPDCHCSEMI